MSSIARRYAKATFEVAQAKNAVAEVDADLARLAGALSDDSNRAAVLSPNVPSETLARVLNKLLGEPHELTKNLVGVVLERHRQAILPDLSTAFRALVRDSRGEIAGIAESAKPLDADALRNLEAHASKLAGKTVTFEVVVNPELIGGVRLRLGNTLYDGSVATVLEDLERSLMEASL